MNCTIRSEASGDIAGIQTLTAAAFLHARHSNHTEHFIVNALRAVGQLTISLVADTGEILIGHVAVSPVVIADGTPHWYGLGAVSVLPEQQGKGVGSHLIREALRLLQSRGGRGCVLVGEPAYYTHIGHPPNCVL